MYYNCFRSPPALSTGTLGLLFYLHCLVATFAQESNAGLQFRYTRRKTVGLVSAVCQRVRHHLWFMLSFLQGFWYFARLRSCKIQVNLRNPAKFTKTRVIPGNSLEIISNTYLCDISETYLGYWGCLLPVNLQIYLETLPQKQANNVPKLAGINDAKNWALAMMMLKALPLAHFSMVLLLKEQMIISVK